MMAARQAIHSFEFDRVSFAFDGAEAIFADVSCILPKTRAVWVRSQGEARGKSTLLKIMAGLLTPQTGRYLINGENVSNMSFEQFLPYRLNLGYGFDMGGLLNNKTLAENLILPLLYHKLADMSEAMTRVAAITDQFGMASVRDQRPFSVSGSQRKLTCLLRAFVHWPQVVFLDDPATGLKQDNLNELYQFVDKSYASRGLRQIFFTSESPDLARRLGAEELVINQDCFMTRSAA